jgi:hypothetical protein
MVIRFAAVAAMLPILYSAELASSPHRGEPQRTPAKISYDEFTKLTPQARRERFSMLPAEEKALIKRMHAERWLAANRSRLSNAQLAVMNEAIDFIRPEIYVRPADTDIVEREEALRQKLTCILGSSNAREAFVFDLPPLSSQAPSLQDRVDEWLSWFSECVLR